MPSAEPLLRADNVARIYGSGPTAVHALRGVSLALGRGALSALKGRSGSGKTTLLNILGGLDRPTSGAVYLGDLRVDQLAEAELTSMRRHRLAFVLQSFGLLPLLSARENVELPLQIAGVPYRQRQERSERWLQYVSLGERMNHRPFELSGGEQQRVAIARALAAEPALILADEPTSAVDSRTGMQVLELFRRIAWETNTAVCLTTHDPAIIELADAVYELVDGRLAGEE